MKQTEQEKLLEYMKTLNEVYGNHAPISSLLLSGACVYLNRWNRIKLAARLLGSSLFLS